MDTKIASLRENYTKDGLHDVNLPDEPITLLRKWFDEAMASQVSEPNAMTLATVDKKGNPNARMVLMKGIGEDGIRLFTNDESTKARELENNPHAAVLSRWAGVERQQLTR